MNGLHSILLAALLVSVSLPGSDDYLAGHTYERDAKYGDAAKSYQTCIDAKGPLADYARVRLAGCRAASGDVQGGIAAYRRLLKNAQDEPWARMARLRLALLLARQKTHAEATPLFTQALSFEPKPWWADERQADAAKSYIETPDARTQGFTIFKNIIATTPLRQRRVDAANILAQSSDPTDRLTAAWGLVKSGERPDALRLLLALAPDALKGDAKSEEWIAAAKAFDPKAKAPTPEQMTQFLALGEKSGRNAWVRVFLAYVVRNETSGGRTANARRACDLLLKASSDTDEAAYALWWLGNRLGDDKKVEEAVAEYERLVKHCSKHSLVDDALFAAGSLQKTAKFTKQAAKTFSRLGQNHPTSRFTPCAWYWAGMCHESLGDKHKATECYKHCADCGPGDFYSHRASQRLHHADVKGYTESQDVKVDGSRSFLRTLDTKAPEEELPPGLRNDARFERLAFFGQNGLEEAEWEAVGLAGMLKSGLSACAIYDYMAQAGLAQTAMDLARVFEWGMKDGRPTPARLAVDYPKAYWPLVTGVAKENNLDPFLILAVARQESTFRPALTSYAGAQGIMQLMPSTAAWLGKSDSELKKCATNLEDPLNSLKLGARYLARMIERSDGNLAYALASYNAGPGNCDKWRVKFANTDLETFIESIPFKETRNYVKIVLGNYAAYCSLYPNP